MRYLGGKTKQAKAICDVLAAERYPLVWDAFVGGGSITAELGRRLPSTTTLLATDANRDLTDMWKAVRSGWLPPLLGRNLTDEEYVWFRAAASSPLRTFVGFACSFGGKWFGGLARDSSGGFFYEQGRRLLAKKAKDLSTVIFEHCDFLTAPLPPPGTLVYCDPPYEGTTGYSGVPPFDSAAFWLRCRDIVAAGSKVFVSEFKAPSYCEPVWSRPRKSSVTRDDHAVLPETLFEVTCK
jgi:DNA adenine methylase